jgi:uncharacterized protein YjeT (DUF2065 family)
MGGELWGDLLSAVALMLVIEGMLPFLNPQGLRKALFLMVQLNDRQLRFAGLSSMLLGVLLLFFIRG